jgi:hypothetical protein
MYTVHSACISASQVGVNLVQGYNNLQQDQGCDLVWNVTLVIYLIAILFSTLPKHIHMLWSYWMQGLLNEDKVIFFKTYLLYSETLLKCVSFKNNLPWTHYTYPNIFPHSKICLKPFLDIFFKSLPQLCCSICGLEVLSLKLPFIVGNKRSHKATDLGCSRGGWVIHWTPLLVKNLNDIVRNVVWRCQDDASSVQQARIIFFWCGPWGFWELNSSKIQWHLF